MTNIKFLLIGTSLSLIPNLTFAQCVATQDCETLGYTETSCNGGKGVKCPFGNKWACLPTKESICKEEGFTLTCNEAGQVGGDSCNGLYKQCTCDSSYQYTCSGTGYSGGSGSACGGKYTSCTCADGYAWKNNSCQQQVMNGPDGDVYKCNGTVVGVKTADMNFYVAMRDLGYINWGDAYRECQKYAFCSNVNGKLPTKEQLRSIYNNKSQVNTMLAANGGTQLINGRYWSSTSVGSYYYFVNMSDGSETYNYNSNYVSYVRPILTSW